MFTSKTTRLFLCLILVDLAVISGMVFPVARVSSSQVMFELSDYTVESEDSVYRWFTLEEGDKVRVELLTRGEVDAYLFNEEQFIEYSSNHVNGYIDSLKMVESGLLEGRAWEGGTFFFLVSNPGDQPVELVFSQCTGTVTHRITLSEKILEKWGFEPEIPEQKMVRDKPGVGSNALLTPMIIGLLMECPQFLLHY